MKESFSIKFYLYNSDKDKDVQGKSKIYLRLTVDRKKSEIYLGYLIDPADWDDKKQRSKKDKRLNEELIFIENRLLTIKRDLQFAGKLFTARTIKDIFTGNDEVSRTLLNYYQEYLDKMSKLPEQYSKLTLEHYKNTFKNLKNFLKAQQQQDIFLSHIDFKWISNFDFFLLSTPNPILGKPMGRNTANKQHARLKAVLCRAQREGLFDHNPYIDFKLKNVKSSREYLTNEELEKILNHPLANNHSLKKVRDIFFFSVYTGLRYKDAMNLKVENIRQDADGTFWIDIIQEKTEEHVVTPLLKHAIEIFKKYDNDERKITGNVLPKISNQKLNAYLKTIADLAGIDKKLTHHVARHTFATTITLSNDVPLEVVSKWLGHTSIKTSQIYAKITKQYFSKIAGMLDKKL